jgi:uncharacterized protein YndB with AHSA1/START domain
MSTSSPTADRLGTLEPTDDGWRVQFVRHLAKPPTVAWQAFVVPELVARWFPSTIVGDLVPGATLRFEIDDSGTEPFDGEVLEADEPHRLAFTWGPDVVRFELAAAGTGTDLTLTVLLCEQGKAARDGAGWHECLDRLVVAESDGGNGADDPAWPELFAIYVERFGPEASTMGPPQEYLDAHPEIASEGSSRGR